MLAFAITNSLSLFVVIVNQVMINMETKTSVRWMILFLGVCFLVLSPAAVPTTRILKSNKEHHVSVQDLLAQDVMKLSDADDLSGEGDEFHGERLLLESTDYPGTGANKNHDPKTPGGA